MFIALCALFAWTTARAANDPRLLWQTIETKHFRIHFYSGEREIAEHVADWAEDIYGRISDVLGYAPSEITDIALTDQTDSANGSATALPFNAIRLYVTAPEDLSPLGDVDDWYRELVTHEFTHIVHTDAIFGLPKLGNRLLGKTFAPNQVQPRWLLEGLAVLMESEHTSGGRLRSSVWQMFMRADVLGNNVATLDQISHTPRRFPQGNLWYLYGSYFLKWVQDTYGPSVLRAMIRDYGDNIVPFAVNRTARRATGKTFEELYPLWIDSLRRDYTAQIAAVQQQGIREGVRITFGGNTARQPRWIPRRAWPEHAGKILYYRDDAHDTAGLYAATVIRDDQGRVMGGRPGDKELVIRTAGSSVPSFTPEGGVVFQSNDVYQNLFSFDDLFFMPPHATSTTGLDDKRTRLTEGFRAVEPDVSPDGRRVVFVTNNRGTRYLQMAGLTDRGLGPVRTLVKSHRFEQVFTPRWSKDGRHVAYSVWTYGGYRDIRLVDVATGQYREITKDRAIDGSPCFSPDGKWLLFHSDRTGISNIYASEIATGRLMQVTNVTTGAFQPDVSPDGRTLAYLGFTHQGFDIFAMSLDEKNWTPAPEGIDTRPPPPTWPARGEYEVKPYNPWQTLVPRRYSVQITPGNYGQASIVTVGGGDIAGFHGVTASLATEWEKPELQGSLSYVYGRMPFDLSMSVSRVIAPRGGYAIGDYRPVWTQEITSLDTAISYPLPRAFDFQSVSLGYSFMRLAGELPTPANRLDPYETPVVPSRGLAGVMRLGWSYSNAQSFLYSVGPEKGFSAGVNFDFSDKALASEFSGFSTIANLSTYLRMPWLRHHALALHAGGGTSGGSYPGRGAFYVGGFVDLPVLDSVRNTLVQGGVLLRGYPVVSMAGRHYGLFNAEYRFPIWNVDAGASTLPVYFNRLSAAAFVDYGSAFDDAATAKFKTGVGAELWFDFTFAYVVPMTFRLGRASGLASGGIDKWYFVAAVPY